ncbi:MAG: FkbM family methyltransferase, partial [Daejeonella sp.]|uniref:FkbM family methyltransferase n=1 Tax=Daejeonella sp. TaxID=2805397 RepID=UPI003C738402
PELFKNFLTRRSEDTNLNIGINDKAYEFKSMQDFFIMSERSLNTFSLSEANDVEASTNYKIEKTVSIPTQDINSILETYFHSKNLDLLSIDTEGLDFLILQALDFNKYSPKILCVETLTFSAAGKEKKRTDLIDFIISKGYFVYADTYINTIFVNNEIWNSR